MVDADTAAGTCFLVACYSHVQEFFPGALKSLMAIVHSGFWCVSDIESVGADHASQCARASGRELNRVIVFCATFILSESTSSVVGLRSDEA